MSASQKLLVERIADTYRLFCTVMAALAAATIAIMMLSTTADATARYVLNNPIPGVFELNEVLLVICFYMGLAWTQIERGHIRVTAFLYRGSERTRIKMDILAWIVTFVFVFLLRMSERGWSDGILSGP